MFADNNTLDSKLVIVAILMMLDDLLINSETYTLQLTLRMYLFD